MKAKKRSRLLSALLALTLVVGMLPTAWAVESEVKATKESTADVTGGTGTETDKSDGDNSSDTTPTEPSTPDPDPESVISVSLDETTLTLTVDDTEKLTATVESSDATNKNVDWSSSDTSVATVDQDGTVTAKAKGEAKITATAGDKSAACAVTVKAPIPVDGVTLNKSTLSLTEGDTETLTATVEPKDATNKDITWKSNDEDVATVDQDGKVTAGKVTTSKTATITAKTVDGGKTDTCTVTVTPKTVAPTLSSSSVTLTGNGKDTATLKVNGLASGAPVRWKTTDSSIASLSSSTTTSVTVTAGKVTRTATATITATVMQNGTDYTLTCKITVKPATLSNVEYSTSADQAVSLTDRSFNTVCYNYTGYNLDHVEFSSNSISGYGELVTDYSNSGDYGPKIATKTPYYTGSGSFRSLSDIAFVPDGSKSGDATFNYTGFYYDSSKTLKSYSGRLVIAISGPSGDINYSTDKNEAVTFDAEDFYDVCSQVLDGKLDYVSFHNYNLTKGTLYYKYDDGDYDRKVSTSTKYYYDESPYLDDVTFVPDKNTTGTTSVRFTAYNTRGRSFTGSVEIAISTSGSSDIVYKTGQDDTVDLDKSDFTDYCKDITGTSSIEWIKFTQPSSSKGTLYYKYGSSSKEEEVSKNEKYYTNSSPKISDITFVPDKKYTGTVTIDFNGEASNGKSFSGSFRVKVGTSSESGDISYSATAGAPVNFNIKDFNTYCKEETDANLDYVKFTRLPNSSSGTLYYDYSSSSSSNTKVSTSTQYKRSSSPYLDRVTFVPDKSSAGTVEIKFTGKNTDGDNFSGTVSITYTPAKDASVIRYTVGAQALPFRSVDFEAACNNRGAAALSSVEFRLPSSSAGVLYYNYTSANQYDSLVMPGLSYSVRSGSRLLPYVSFVPTAGFVGTVTVQYTGTDTQNATFQGTVEITVTQDNAKPTFTDMGSAQWASEAVDYLYQRGITTGTTATTFNPSGKITRGDFILMLCRAFNLNSNATDNFKDVPASSYYAQAIATAKALGIATGSGDGNFHPNANLTREDAMVFIQRTLSRTGHGVADAPASYLDKFPDGENVSSYAQSAVAALVQAGFIQGDNAGRLNPKGSLTRAEMAVILYRVLTK